MVPTRAPNGFLLPMHTCFSYIYARSLPRTCTYDHLILYILAMHVCFLYFKSCHIIYTFDANPYYLLFTLVFHSCVQISFHPCIHVLYVPRHVCSVVYTDTSKFHVCSFVVHIKRGVRFELY